MLICILLFYQPPIINRQISRKKYKLLTSYVGKYVLFSTCFYNLERKNKNNAKNY